MAFGVSASYFVGIQLDDVIARCTPAESLAVVKLDERGAWAPSWGCSKADRENLRKGAVTPVVGDHEVILLTAVVDVLHLGPVYPASN